MALTSYTTTTTFYRLGEVLDGFSGVHVFGTGLTYTDNGGVFELTGGTITSVKFFIDGVALVAMRDLPVTDVASLLGVLSSALTVPVGSDPYAAFDEVLQAFEGATFVDLNVNGLSGSVLSNDVLQANALGGGLDGLDGDDILIGRNGRDDIFGGAGNDEIYGGGSGDFIVGGLGNDLMKAGGGNDTVFDLEGEDTVRLGGGDDYLQATQLNNTYLATSGDDIVFGGSGDDFLILSDGDDKIFGGTGNDTIFTSEGRDVVRGGAGLDLIAIGGGQNQLYGGDDGDVFLFVGTSLFDAPRASTNQAGFVSIIRDFDVTEDVLGLTTASFFGANDPNADYLAFLAQSVQVGSDVRFTDAATGQRVIIKNTDLDDLTFDNFFAGAPIEVL